MLYVDGQCYPALNDVVQQRGTTAPAKKVLTNNQCCANQLCITYTESRNSPLRCACCMTKFVGIVIIYMYVFFACFERLLCGKNRDMYVEVYLITIIIVIVTDLSFS